MALRYLSELCGALEPVTREKGWIHSPYAYDQAARAVGALFQAFRPSGASPDFSNVDWMEKVGVNMARTAVGAIAAGRGPWEVSVADKLGDLLGTAMSRLSPGTFEDGMFDLLDTALVKLGPAAGEDGEGK